MAKSYEELQFTDDFMFGKVMEDKELCRDVLECLLCLSEAGLIRLLIRGYEPKEKPDDRFYDVMRELSSIGNNINQLAAKANTLGFIDAPMLKNEAAKWNKFQSEIERTYLRPNQSEMKWQ